MMEVQTRFGSESPRTVGEFPMYVPMRTGTVIVREQG
jgi:hypothetical protein